MYIYVYIYIHVYIYVFTVTFSRLPVALHEVPEAQAERLAVRFGFRQPCVDDGLDLGLRLPFRVDDCSTEKSECRVYDTCDTYDIL